MPPAIRIKTAALYWRTVRHLRPIQIGARFWSKVPKPRLSRAPAPSMRLAQGRWAPTITRHPGALGRNRFSFLNREADLKFPVGWNDPATPKLWLYNLHYFDDLGCSFGAANVDACLDLAERWIAENPPARGNGWEPYPLSLRIVNWLKHCLAGRALSDSMRNSLAVQVRALEQRIEWHILANHLFANAKALTFAGLCFDGAEGERWLRKGIKLLDREIPAQILEDGGHIERSPMYHAIILEDLLDLLNASVVFPGLIGERKNAWTLAIHRMFSWLTAMSHPDGDIAFFNDCALGIAPKPADLAAYAVRNGLPTAPQPVAAVADLRASGYLRVNKGAFALLFDAAPVGPDYQPGHAHADTLSFELSVGAQRVFVNSGVSTYDVGRLRAAERSTAAHNTVEVDGGNSSEVWAAFRVARRAQVLRRFVEEAGDAVIIEASHDGYRRCGGGVTHHRAIHVSTNSMQLTDRIEGAFAKATTRFRLSPGLTALLSGDGRRGVVFCDARPILDWMSSEPGRLVPILQAVAFNRREPTQEIQIDFRERSVSVEMLLRR